jgi:hypothetical protein
MRERVCVCYGTVGGKSKKRASDIILYNTGSYRKLFKEWGLPKVDQRIDVCVCVCVCVCARARVVSNIITYTHTHTKREQNTES